MTFDIDNEKLAAYVLGELDETEREAVEKALESDESLRATVAELRATATLAAKALQAEPAHELTESQRAAISKKAEAVSISARIAGLLSWIKEARASGRPLLRWQFAAACVLIIGIVGMIVVPSLAPPAHRMRGGVIVGMEEAASRRATRGRAMPGRAGNRTVPWFGDDTLQLDRKEEKGVAPGSLALLEPSQPGRYLIKNASIQIETEDARKASETLVAALEKLGGYVSDLRESVDSLGRRSIQVQIRVPADRFDATMQQLEPLGKILNREISTADVTEEFVDTDARVRNLKATEERLLKHFERTGDLEGIVEIERELNRIREQIERLQGRLRYLSNRVDFSTFNISLQEKPKAGPVVPPETFSVGKIASEATRRLVGFFQNLTARIIWLGIWAVVWVPLLAVAIFLIRRAVRQARKAQD